VDMPLTVYVLEDQLRDQFQELVHVDRWWHVQGEED
jgi:hypothetical protein